MTLLNIHVVNALSNGSIFIHNRWLETSRHCKRVPCDYGRHVQAFGFGMLNNPLSWVQRRQTLVKIRALFHALLWTLLFFLTLKIPLQVILVILISLLVKQLSYLFMLKTQYSLFIETKLHSLWFGWWVVPWSLITCWIRIKKRITLLCKQFLSHLSRFV